MDWLPSSNDVQTFVEIKFDLFLCLLIATLLFLPTLSELSTYFIHDMAIVALIDSTI